MNDIDSFPRRIVCARLTVRHTPAREVPDGAMTSRIPFNHRVTAHAFIRVGERQRWLVSWMTHPRMGPDDIVWWVECVVIL